MKSPLPKPLLVAAVASLCSCEIKDEGNPAPDPTPVRRMTPRSRFWDRTHKEHVHTYGGTEVFNWRPIGTSLSEHVAGYAVNDAGAGAARLTRAYGRDGRHHFYRAKTAGATGVERIEDFVPDVWIKPGPSLVPVHARFLPDDKDPVFDARPGVVRAHPPETLRATGVRREGVEAVPYLYPPTGGPTGGPTPPVVGIAPSWRP